jgi:hypothetical protein
MAVELWQSKTARVSHQEAEWEGGIGFKVYLSKA